MVLFMVLTMAELGFSPTPSQAFVNETPLPSGDVTMNSVAGPRFVQVIFTFRRFIDPEKTPFMDKAKPRASKI